LSQSGRATFFADDQRLRRRNVLPAHVELRIAQPASDTGDLCHRSLFRRYPWRLDVGDSAGGVLHGTLIVAMDILEWRTPDAFDDAVYLPGHRKSSAGFGPPAQSELAGISLCEHRSQSAVRRA